MEVVSVKMEKTTNFLANQPRIINVEMNRKNTKHELSLLLLLTIIITLPSPYAEDSPTQLAFPDMKLVAMRSVHSSNSLLRDRSETLCSTGWKHVEALPPAVKLPRSRSVVLPHISCLFIAERRITRSVLLEVPAVARLDSSLSIGSAAVHKQHVMTQACICMKDTVSPALLTPMEHFPEIKN